MSFDSIAQPWAAANNNTQNRLRIKANDFFFFMHHPTSWIAREIGTGKKKKWIWLPKLNKFIEKPGVNNIRGQVGATDSSLARTQFQDQGFTILHPSKHDYMRIYPAIKGKYHTTKFFTLENLAGEIIFKEKTEELETWLCSLISGGTLEPPHEHIMKRIMHKQQELINMHVNKSHLPLQKGQLSEAETLLQGMQAATDGIMKEGKSYYER